MSSRKKETLDNCIPKWAPELAHYCPDVPVILVGMLNCSRYNFENRDTPDVFWERCVSEERSEEEGKEAARRIGKYSVYL